MNINFCSAFRNSAHYVDKYLQRIALLRILMPNDSFHVVAGEGDSTDETKRMLELNAKWTQIPVRVVDVSHGGPVFGSTEAPERMVALSKVCNTMLDNIDREADVLVYVESDLDWMPHVICTLIERALWRKDGFDVFAPMVMAGEAFYDTWGFRCDGQRFSPFPPFHPALKGKKIVEIESAGSCLVMRAQVAHECRIRNDYCLVGWCEDARGKGYKIAACTDLEVYQR